MASFDQVFDLCLRRGFIIPSSEIYGGLAGFYDYGPLGCALKNKILAAYRDFCIRREGYVEIDGTNIMRGEVLQASGHVANFVDPVVKCTKCGEVFRADHLISEALKKNVEGLKAEEFDGLIQKNKVGCPKCKGKLGKVEVFHLMFKMNIGAGEGVDAYLRPETAQSIYVDFHRVFNACRQTLPLGIVQIGKAYRNEIAPRQGLIRLREFTQMEIEIFLDPETVNSHPKWNELKNAKVRILTREAQNADGKDIDATIQEFLDKNVLPNQYMAYWLAKATLFYTKLGIPYEVFKFRHLMPEETPFYSKGNFDMEVMTSFGWKETIGTAYRSDYDLSTHGKHSGKSPEVMSNGKKVVPHVVEPSWGLDRLIYCVLEHNYVEKGADREWAWMKFPAPIAPIGLGVFPLVKKDGLLEKSLEVYKLLLDAGFEVFHDEGGAIGKRYARADEVGVPFCITIDHQTLEDGTVTIRDRDTTKQARESISNLVAVLGPKFRIDWSK